ncbi:MAG: hypothetical protein ABIJ92_02955 [Candidatus Aenigmatarchaeota archaeon]
MKSSTKTTIGIIGILLLLFSLQVIADPIDLGREEIKDYYWMTVCGDNQEINLDTESAEEYCLAEEDGVPTNCTKIQEIYVESLETNQSRPECINEITGDDGNTSIEYDVDCIMETCSELIEFNQLTGETRSVWTKKYGWSL